MFKFPSNDKLRLLWLKSIRREIIDENGKRSTFKPTKNHRVCSLHFDENDYVTVSEDTHSTRKAKKPSLQVNRLKSTSVPHVFMDFPAYLQSTPLWLKPVSKCTAEQRLLREKESVEFQESSMHLLDSIKSIDDIEEKLKASHLPSDFVSVRRDSIFMFMYVPNLEAEEPRSVDCLIKLTANLSVTIYVKGKRLPTNLYNHLLAKFETVSSMTELCNVT